MPGSLNLHQTKGKLVMSNFGSSQSTFDASHVQVLPAPQLTAENITLLRNLVINGELIPGFMTTGSNTLTLFGMH
jgi:hypothetical protein